MHLSYHCFIISFCNKVSHQVHHQERHGSLLQVDFETFIKNGAPVDLRLDPHHDSSLDYIEKVSYLSLFTTDLNTFTVFVTIDCQ